MAKYIKLSEETFLMLLDLRFEEGYKVGIENRAMDEYREKFIRDQAKVYLNNWAICCPFHQEKAPSCIYRPVDKSFRCFGCSQEGSLRVLFQKLKDAQLLHIADKKGAIVK